MEMTKSKAKNKGYVVALRKCANVPHNISSTVGSGLTRKSVADNNRDLARALAESEQRLADAINTNAQIANEKTAMLRRFSKIRLALQEMAKHQQDSVDALHRALMACCENVNRLNSDSTLVVSPRPSQLQQNAITNAACSKPCNEDVVELVGDELMDLTDVEQHFSKTAANANNNLSLIMEQSIMPEMVHNSFWSSSDQPSTSPIGIQTKIGKCAPPISAQGELLSSNKNKCVLKSTQEVDQDSTSFFHKFISLNDDSAVPKRTTTNLSKLPVASGRVFRSDEVLERLQKNSLNILSQQDYDEVPVGPKSRKSLPDNLEPAYVSADVIASLDNRFSNDTSDKINQNREISKTKARRGTYTVVNELLTDQHIELVDSPDIMRNVVNAINLADCNVTNRSTVDMDIQATTPSVDDNDDVNMDSTILASSLDRAILDTSLEILKRDKFSDSDNEELSIRQTHITEKTDLKSGRKGRPRRETFAITKPPVIPVTNNNTTSLKLPKTPTENNTVSTQVSIASIAENKTMSVKPPVIPISDSITMSATVNKPPLSSASLSRGRPKKVIQELNVRRSTSRSRSRTMSRESTIRTQTEAMINTNPLDSSDPEKTICYSPCNIKIGGNKLSVEYKYETPRAETGIDIALKANVDISYEEKRAADAVFSSPAGIGLVDTSRTSSNFIADDIQTVKVKNVTLRRRGSEKEVILHMEENNNGKECISANNDTKERELITKNDVLHNNYSPNEKRLDIIKTLEESMASEISSASDVRKSQSYETVFKKPGSLAFVKKTSIEHEQKRKKLSSVNVTEKSKRKQSRKLNMAADILLADEHNLASGSTKTIFDMSADESMTVLPQTKLSHFCEHKEAQKQSFAAMKEGVVETSDSPHGIMTLLGNGKRTKPREGSKKVSYSREKPNTVVFTPPSQSMKAEDGGLIVKKLAGQTPFKPKLEIQVKNVEEQLENQMSGKARQPREDSELESSENSSENKPSQLLISKKEKTKKHQHKAVLPYPEHQHADEVKALINVEKKKVKKHHKHRYPADKDAIENMVTLISDEKHDERPSDVTSDKNVVKNIAKKVINEKKEVESPVKEKLQSADEDNKETPFEDVKKTKSKIRKEKVGNEIIASSQESVFTNDHLFSTVKKAPRLKEKKSTKETECQGNSHFNSQNISQSNKENEKSVDSVTEPAAEVKLSSGKRKLDLTGDSDFQSNRNSESNGDDNGDNDRYSHRRKKSNVSYKEIPLNKKLRRGDELFLTKTLTSSSVSLTDTAPRQSMIISASECD